VTDLDRIASALERIAHSLELVVESRRPGPKTKRKPPEFSPPAASATVTPLVRSMAARALKRHGIDKR